MIRYVHTSHIGNEAYFKLNGFRSVLSSNLPEDDYIENELGIK
jgi:hypothetical protein